MTNLYFTVTCYISADATLWSVCNPLAFVSWINKALSIYLSDDKNPSTHPHDSVVARPVARQARFLRHVAAVRHAARRQTSVVKLSRHVYPRSSLRRSLQYKP